MATVRYVILVPTEVEEEVIGSSDRAVTEWGRQLAKTKFPTVSSSSPRKTIPYEPFLAEAVVLDDADDAPVDMEELVAPGAVA